MPKRHRGPYPPEFRRRIVELVRAGRSPESLAKEFEPTAPCIRSWVRQASLDEGTRTDGLTTDERGELAQLRRDVKTLREERDILKKFAAWSVQEASRTPPKRSGS
jgi:transposase